MRSLVIISPYYDPDPGASTLRCRAFSKYISDVCEVTILTRHHAKRVGYSSGKNIFRLSLRSSFMSIFSDYRLMLRIVSSADDVIVSVPSIYMGFSGTLLAWRRHAILYVDVRDVPVKSGIFGWIQWVMLLYICARAHTVFVTTDIQGDQLKKYICFRNVVVIPNGVDDIRPSSKTYDLCFLGSVNPERNPYVLSEVFDQALKMRPSTSIQWIGYDANNLCEISFKRRFHGRITCVDETSSDVAVEIMSHARIGLITMADWPSLDGQLPTKVYEYCSRGLIVAGCLPRRETALRRFIEERGVGVVHHDPYQLASMIVDLLSDSIRMDSLSSRALLVSRDFLRDCIFAPLRFIFHE